MPAVVKNKRGIGELEEDSSNLPSLRPTKMKETSPVKLRPPSEDILNNRFCISDLGPFVVQVYDIRGLRLGNLHIMSFGEKLLKFERGIKYIKPSGLDRVNIVFNNFKDANEMVANTIKQVDPNYGAYIPDSIIFKVGLIKGVDPNKSEESILSSIRVMDGGALIHKVQRIFYFETNAVGERIKTPSSRVKIFFRGNALPKKVVLLFVVRDVHPYFPAVKRCGNCQRFGHIRFQCRGKVRCNRCAGDHPERDCLLTEERDPLSRCANCEGSHWASDRNCPAFTEKKNILNKLIKEGNKDLYSAPRDTTQSFSGRINDKKQFPALPSAQRPSRSEPMSIGSTAGIPRGRGILRSFTRGGGAGRPGLPRALSVVSEDDSMYLDSDLDDASGGSGSQADHPAPGPAGEFVRRGEVESMIKNQIKVFLGKFSETLCNNIAKEFQDHARIVKSIKATEESFLKSLGPYDHE